MAASKIASRVAVADTPGCGWAVARYGKEEIVAPGRASEWLGSLPVRALRLAPATVESLRDVGIERIAQLASKPRASLQPRFGSELPLRMDQALGSAAEVLISIVPPEVPRNRTSRANRNAAHLDKLLAERLVLVDPGFGIYEATLTASWIEALTERQTVGAHVAKAGESADVGELVDRLRVKLGSERVFRVEPVESDIPERAA